MFRSHLSARLESGSPLRGLRVVNAADAGPVLVYIYDEIGHWGITAKDVIVALADVAPGSDVHVHVNSPGGDVFDGIAIYNALKNFNGKITTICDGLAASAASFIFQAGLTRTVTKNSQMMIHDAMGLCVGNAEDMAKMVELLDRASDNIASIYAERSDSSTDEWRAAMKDETWYSADEAVTAGLADDVLGETDDTSATNVWDVRFFNARPATATSDKKTGVTEHDQDGKRTVVDDIVESLKGAWK